MFLREKRIGNYTYLYLVESVRVAGKPRQRIVANLGRKETVTADGTLERLLRSISRTSKGSLLLSSLDKDEGLAAATKRIGPVLVFERLWRETGCQRVLLDLLADRRHGASRWSARYS